MPAARGHRLLLALGLVLATVLATPSSGTEGTPPLEGSVPVYAYFYQWYNRASWDRAKVDVPLAGRYSSDNPRVLREQVRQAKSAGITGFLTSWKNTPTLTRRLTLLLQVAHDESFDVGVVYQSLDFRRRPLPLATVRADMAFLVTRFGPQLRSARYGRPLIAWTGTNQYPEPAVRSVRAGLGSRAFLLATSKNVDDYQTIAHDVDGEAYYWSSADPGSDRTADKLAAMGNAVHAHHGIWIAPVAGGFDARALGHSRVIDRRGGQTLRSSLDVALGSSPDAVGVISWNEWSENTYIEPGEKYGDQELSVLRDYLRQRFHQPLPSGPATWRSADGRSTGWCGLRALIVLVALSAAGAGALVLRARSTGG